MAMTHYGNKTTYDSITLRETKRTYLGMVTHYCIFQKHRMMIHMRISPDSTATVNNRA